MASVPYLAMKSPESDSDSVSESILKHIDLKADSGFEFPNFVRSIRSMLRAFAKRSVNHIVLNYLLRGPILTLAGLLFKIS